MKLRNNLILVLLTSLTLFPCLFQNKIAESTFSSSTTYFPTGNWRKSSPDEVKMNSSKLDSMYQYIISQDIGIDSIHIVRHGYLVYEEYFDYYNYSSLHPMWSTTKSIISILIGIANETGFITNLDEPILNIFSERSFTNMDARKQDITIRHLLKMQSGIQWNEHDVPNLIGTVDKHDYELLTNQTMECLLESWPFNPVNDLFQMFNSSDSIQYLLDKPMESDPGTKFYYNSGTTHLLSAIIQKKTGMPTETFANNCLFSQLNITEYSWFKDSLNITVGGLGLWLKPFDMLKIGYLYLNKGMWNGTQIVPIKWVRESTQEYTSGYGYLWWIDRQGRNFYYSHGFAGQYIIVKPDKNLVIAITASECHTNFPYVVISSYILESILAETTYFTSFSSLLVLFPYLILTTLVWRRKDS